MKKLLHYADCLILLGAIVGCVLRLWFSTEGLDGRGLYDTTHPAWLLLCLLSLGMVVFSWFLTRDVGTNRDYTANFPKSKVSFATNGLLAIYLGYTGLMALRENDGWMELAVAIASLVAALGLALNAANRLEGSKPASLTHMFPCVFFALRLFLLGKAFGTEPELCSFLFRFFASVALIPAYYCLWSFDVEEGNRRYSLFFSLIAVFFCLITTVETQEGWVLYMLSAACLLTDLCRQRYLPGPAPQAEVPAAATEEAPKEATPEAPEARPVLHGNIDPEAHMDAFLEDIKLFLDDQGY